jgi:hypothetical protein
VAVGGGKDIAAKLETLLTEEQKKQLLAMRQLAGGVDA